VVITDAQVAVLKVSSDSLAVSYREIGMLTCAAFDICPRPTRRGEISPCPVFNVSEDLSGKLLTAPAYATSPSAHPGRHSRRCPAVKPSRRTRMTYRRTQSIPPPKRRRPLQRSTPRGRTGERRAWTHRAEYQGKPDITGATGLTRSQWRNTR
jgi:hypothetical protein